MSRRKLAFGAGILAAALALALAACGDNGGPGGAQPRPINGIDVFGLGTDGALDLWLSDEFAELGMAALTASALPANTTDADTSLAWEVPAEYEDYLQLSDIAADGSGATVTALAVPESGPARVAVSSVARPDVSRLIDVFIQPDAAAEAIVPDANNPDAVYMRGTATLRVTLDPSSAIDLLDWGVAAGFEDYIEIADVSDDTLSATIMGLAVNPAAQVTVSTRRTQALAGTGPAPAETITIEVTRPPAASSISFTVDGQPAGAARGLLLGEYVTLELATVPAVAYVGSVTWPDSNDYLQITPAANGWSATVTALSVPAAGPVAVTVTSDAAVGLQATINLTITDPPRFVVFNQAATPPANTTTAWPEMDDRNRFRIDNMHNTDGSGFGNAPGLTNTTFVYWNVPITGAASITARVRLVERRHPNNPTTTSAGVLIGMFTEPRGNGNFLPSAPEETRGWFYGVRLANNGSLAAFGARSQDNTNSGSTAVPGSAGRDWDDEYIIEVSRTTTTNYVITLRDRNGVQLGTITRSGNQVQDFSSAYLGFIVHAASVEISQVQIRNNAGFTGATVASTLNSAPTPPPTEATNVTVAASPASAQVNLPITFTATVLPLTLANRDVTWDVQPSGEATIVSQTGTQVTVTRATPGDVTVTATAVVSGAGGAEVASSPSTATFTPTLTWGAPINVSFSQWTAGAVPDPMPDDPADVAALRTPFANALLIANPTFTQGTGNTDVTNFTLQHGGVNFIFGSQNLDGETGRGQQGWIGTMVRNTYTGFITSGGRVRTVRIPAITGSTRVTIAYAHTSGTPGDERRPVVNGSSGGAAAAPATGTSASPATYSWIIGPNTDIIIGSDLSISFLRLTIEREVTSE
jgi:hypothetical protein